MGLPQGSEELSHDPSTNLLDEEEIVKFFGDLGGDKNGYVTFDELFSKLEAFHHETTPEAKKEHRQNLERRLSRRNPQSNDLERAQSREPAHEGLRAFLNDLLPGDRSRLFKREFVDIVRAWKIPYQSQKQTRISEQDAEDDARRYEQRLPFRRRARARFWVDGPRILFITLVVALQLAFGVWQMVKYIRNKDARAGLGQGVIVAKATAGALMPTMFFMILSMSRWFSTFMRRWRHFSRIVNWDLHQAFHIWMSVTALALATVHAIGHLAGTFRSGSHAAHQPTVAALLGRPEHSRMDYSDFVRLRPGWSGLGALGIFYTIALLSQPAVRRHSYELFQLTHLLIFPLIALLLLHGTAALLQSPMLGYWLAFPVLLVTLERLHRLYRGFVRVPARLQILDRDTVTLRCYHPQGHRWRYSAGQYILLQIPSISLFQWHPFTVSGCQDNMLQVHIKTGGDWTGALRKLPTDREIRVGIDGPFGAPAQRFYEFDRAIIIGAGIGVTPFSGILTDIEQKLQDGVDPWKREGKMKQLSAAAKRQWGSLSERAASFSMDDVSASGGWSGASSIRSGVTSKPPRRRRVDFHWMVREQDQLMWFSDLLNRAYEMSQLAASSIASRAFPLKMPPPIGSPASFPSSNYDSNSSSITTLAQSPYPLSSPATPPPARMKLKSRRSTYPSVRRPVNLELNIHTHITASPYSKQTQKPLSLSETTIQIYRTLVTRYRLGLRPASHNSFGTLPDPSYGRPDLTAILEEFHRQEFLSGGKAKDAAPTTRNVTWSREGDLRAHGGRGEGRQSRGQRVGVFFCGSPTIARALADACEQLNKKAMVDGSTNRAGVTPQYVLCLEVFG